MREIKFRGKHIHSLPQNEHLDGRWVYGYLCNENYINSPELEGEFLVSAESIGQYTGLHDVNGKEIYEGDIVRFDDCSNYPIFWDSDYCAFGSCWYSDFDHISEYRNVKMEVVGNICDNPELLEMEE